MLGSQVKVLLVAFSSVLLVQVRRRSTQRHADRNTEDRSGKRQGEIFAYLLMLKFVSELMAAEGDQMLPEPEEDEEAMGVGGGEVMRRHLPLTQRERKAGCRNFFWKTFTSC
ncbi:Somatostatin-37 Somatostatin-34 [Collichthys lucidus]|uniref:Somatostatin-37 Somatostatin-34 n=1 Tax=Collichthys lucidus TaxID=240159 RepID=A0A4U5VVP4_COLLU|nr:Somatostatin-37 Somatostatin-34 [Collichthys lucidus]